MKCCPALKSGSYPLGKNVLLFKETSSSPPYSKEHVTMPYPHHTIEFHL
jgi:hypothetical protein